MRPTIGFIGLGIMGLPMAGNLLKGGYDLVVYNRTPGKAGDLVARGAASADSPRAVAERAQIVISIVTDTPDVEQVLFGDNGVAAGATPGTLFIDMSTISPEATRGFARRLRQQNVGYLDAPVSGGDVGARNGTLTIMVGGEKADFDRAQPVLAAMGSRVTHVGPSGAGQTVKACNQILCAVNMVATCEALALAAASGVDLATLHQVLTGGAGNSWAFEKLGKQIIEGNLDPGFMVRLIQKDLEIVHRAAATLKVPLPGTALAADQFRAVEAADRGDAGTQAMVTVYEKLTGRRIRGGTENSGDLD